MGSAPEQKWFENNAIDLYFLDFIMIYEIEMFKVARHQ